MAAPSILSSQFSTSATSDSTSFTPTMPTVTAGKALVALIAVDGNPTINPDNASFSNGWRYRNSGVNGTAVTGVLLYKERAEGGSADNLTVTASNAQQYSAWLACIDAGNFPNIFCTDTNGSSTNSNPPIANWGSSKEVLIIVARMGDAAVVATAAPSGYSGLASQAGGANGASISIATKTETDDDEDPGAFTSATEQWAAFTLAIWAETGTRWARDDAGGIVFSNNDLTVEMAAGIFEQGVRATIPHKTGKWGFNVSLGPTSWASYGLCTGDGFMSDLSFDWLVRFGDREGIEGRWSVGTETDEIEQAGFPEPADEDVVYMLFDLDVGRFWFKVNSNDWNYDTGADPDSGTGGIDMTGVLAAGSEYLWPFFYGDEVSELTGDFGATALSGLSDAGTFNYWDYVPSAGYTLAAAVGSFAISGNAAALSTGRRILAASGSLAIIGYDAALRYGKRFVAGVGAFAVTSIAASLRVARRLAAAQGSVTVTGITAALKYGRRMAAAMGSFAIAGLDAALTVASLGHQLAAAAGSFAVTGISAGVRVSRYMSAAHGSFTITGYTATLRAMRRFAAAAGAYAVTGISAVLKTARRLIAAAGSFTATGYAASFQKGKILVAGYGSFLVAAMSAALNRASLLRGQAASIVVAGQEADFIHDRPAHWDPVPGLQGNWSEMPTDSEIWTEQGPGASPWDPV